jgi:hypothetical protein
MPPKSVQWFWDNDMHNYNSLSKIRVGGRTDHT